MSPVRTTIDLLEAAFASWGLKVWPRMQAPVADYGSLDNPQFVTARQIAMTSDESLGAFVRRVAGAHANVAVYEITSANGQRVARVALW